MNSLEDLIIEWEDRPLYPGVWATDFIERLLETAGALKQEIEEWKAAALLQRGEP